MMFLYQVGLRKNIVQKSERTKIILVQFVEQLRMSVLQFSEDCFQYNKILYTSCERPSRYSQNANTLLKYKHSLFFL